jgi:glucose-6-phosphate isomerase
MRSLNPNAMYQNALQQVIRQAQGASAISIIDLFTDEPERISTLCVDAAGLHLDLSRQKIRASDLGALLALARACGFEARRDALLRGDHVNTTEVRAALHTALRRHKTGPLRVDGEDLMPMIDAGLQKMREFSRQIRDGQRCGSDGRRITDVVNIGIGGSQLGPLLACQALREQADNGPDVHFLSNIDPGSWQAIRRRLDPRTTLVVVASKSWRTAETTRNAEAVRQWLLDSGIDASDLPRHLIGITAHPERAREDGLSDDSIFPFWDWVGGRFSLWSAIGLPVMLAIGPEAFDQMRSGARAMDEHFASAAPERNAPLLLALTTLWNRLALSDATEAVIPYCDALSRLPAYLQQLQMESNGKSVDIDGNPLAVPTIPVIWGEAGTDAQHSFFQALHQGTAAHPVEFIIAIPPQPDPQRRDYALVANALAQAEALMRGRNLESSRAEMIASGVEKSRAEALAPHRVHPGNRPSTTILLNQLTPYSFGALIALYEHKTAALGWLWRINSFDQWGVELGKQLADRMESLLQERDAPLNDMDPSTAALVQRLREQLSER